MQEKLEKHICYQETPQLNKSLVTFVVYEKCAEHTEVRKICISITNLMHPCFMK